MIKSTKRIALVLEELNRGGIGSVCRLLAEELCSLGAHVTLVSLKPNERSGNAAQFEYDVFYLDPKKSVHDGLVEFLQHAPQDVVISNDVHRASASMPIIHSTSLHILWIHDSFKSNMNFAIANIENCDAIVCVADHVREKLLGQLPIGPTTVPIRRIHNGVKRVDRTGVRSEVTEFVDVLFMGNSDPIKGVHDLMHIASMIRKRQQNVRILVAGNINKRLKYELARRQLEEYVVWLGWLTHEECIDAARRCFFFLMLSRKEAFGMVTVEAMSVGCVPIAYDVVSGNTEIIVNMKNGILVPFGGIERIGDSFDMLKRDSVLYESLSTAAIDSVNDRFLIHRTGIECIKLIADIELIGKVKCRSFDSQVGISCQIGKSRPFSYNHLPSGFREWIRYQVCKNPFICRWILDRWL